MGYFNAAGDKRGRNLGDFSGVDVLRISRVAVFSGSSLYGKDVSPLNESLPSSSQAVAVCIASPSASSLVIIHFSSSYLLSSFSSSIAS